MNPRVKLVSETRYRTETTDKVIADETASACDQYFLHNSIALDFSKNDTEGKGIAHLQNFGNFALLT